LIRTRDTGEIYLLSLDTFMIMAVMGLTLGTIFFIVNPNLALSDDLVTQEMESSVTSTEFNRCFSIAENIGGFNTTDPSMWFFQSSNNWSITIRFENINSNRLTALVGAFDEAGMVLEDRQNIMRYLSRFPQLRDCLGF